MRPLTAHLTMRMRTMLFAAIWREYNKSTTSPAYAGDLERRKYWDAIMTLMNDRMSPSVAGGGEGVFFDELEYLVSPTPPARRPPHPGPPPYIVWDNSNEMHRSWGVWIEEAFTEGDTDEGIRARLREALMYATKDDTYQQHQAATWWPFENEQTNLRRALEGHITLEAFRADVRRARWHTPNILSNDD